MRYERCTRIPCCKASTSLLALDSLCVFTVYSKLIQRKISGQNVPVTVSSSLVSRLIVACLSLVCRLFVDYLSLACS